jgi:hypothetical protein
LFAQPSTAIVLWKPRKGYSLDRILTDLPAGMASTVTIDNSKWIRHTAANPNADIVRIVHTLNQVLESAQE